MKKWRKSRDLQEIPASNGGNLQQSSQMKWRLSKRPQQQVANAIQVVDSRGTLGGGGSYFRSISEDNIIASRSSPPPPPVVDVIKHEDNSTLIVHQVSTTSSSSNEVNTTTHLRRTSNSTSSSVEVEPPSSSEIAAAAIVAAVTRQDIKLDNYTQKSSIDININQLDQKSSSIIIEDPWSYNIGRNFNNLSNDFNNTIVISSNNINHEDNNIVLNWSPPSSVRSERNNEHEVIHHQDRRQIIGSQGEEVPEDPWSSKNLRQFSPMASTASLISSQLQTSSRVKLRCGWAPGVAAAVLAVSAAVSLGNVLRLPRLVLLHGGGPFLVAYIIVLMVLGLPLTFLEIGLGQFCQQGSLQIYRAVPLLKGVGVVKLVTGLLLCTYYPVLMAVSLFSLIWSAKGPLPFNECSKNAINTYHFALGYSLAEKEISFGETCLKSSMLKQPQEDAMWLGVNYALLFLLWAFLTLSQWRGTKWYRRTMVITVLLSFAALVTVLVRASTAKPLHWPLDWIQWQSLLKPDVWYFATVQVFFSTQVGFGVNVTNAGKIFPKKNAFWVSLSLIILNLAVGLCAVWLTWLWLESSSVETKSLLGSDLPETLVLSLIIDYASKGPKWLNQLWACFACLMLVIAGFITVTNLLYSLITAIASETPAEKFRRWHILAGVCGLGFVTGVLCFIPVNLQFVHILDHYVIGRLLMATTILELIGFAWIYGCNTLYNDFEFVLGQKMNVMWKIIWTIAPVVLLAIELWSIFQLPLDGLPYSQRNTKPDPDWVTITGWSMYLSMWLIVFGSAVWTLGQQVDYNFADRLRSSIKPSSKWGPADPLHRHGWVRWRTQYSTTGRKDFTLRRRGTRDYTHSARGSPATTLGRPGSNKNGGPSPLAAVGTAASMPWQSNPSP